MNILNKGKILFLGEENSPSLKWMRSIGEPVIQTANKIESSLIQKENVVFLVSYGYRHIIRKTILDQFPDRAINLHISLLPWNKGADPNFWSFVDNTPKGVTIHYLDDGIDTGDIIVQQELKFESSQETLATTYQQLQVAVQDLFQENWESIKNATCSRRPQQAKGSLHKRREKAAYNGMLTKNWDTSIETLRSNIAQNADSLKLRPRNDQTE